MTPRILIDARDGAAAQIRGWGRYTRELVLALRAGGADGLEILAPAGSGVAPEVAFEQLWLPVLARRHRAAVVHAPNCFLPVVRPCPGVVTIHDLAFETWPGDFPATTAMKFRTITRLAARSAQRIICPSQFTAADVCRRYGVDPGKVRVIAEAPALAAAGGATDTPWPTRRRSRSSSPSATCAPRRTWRRSSGRSPSCEPPPASLTGSCSPGSTPARGLGSRSWPAACRCR